MQSYLTWPLSTMTSLNEVSFKIVFLFSPKQRLLMSVLPEHLIEEMKNDLAQEGGSISKRKIYMKTYEPVR